MKGKSKSIDPTLLQNHQNNSNNNNILEKNSSQNLPTQGQFLPFVGKIQSPAIGEEELKITPIENPNNNSNNSNNNNMSLSLADSSSSSGATISTLQGSRTSGNDNSRRHDRDRSNHRQTRESSKNRNHLRDRSSNRQNNTSSSNNVQNIVKQSLTPQTSLLSNKTAATSISRQYSNDNSNLNPNATASDFRRAKDRAPTKRDYGSSTTKSSTKNYDKELLKNSRSTDAGLKALKAREISNNKTVSSTSSSSNTTVTNNNHNNTSKMDLNNSQNANNNNTSLPPIITPLEAPVYGGQNVTITLPLELAEQANLRQKTIHRIYKKQKMIYKLNKLQKSENSFEDDNNTNTIAELQSSIRQIDAKKLPSLYLLITGSSQRHLCELKIKKVNSVYVSMYSMLPEHEPPEKTKVSLIVWRNGSSQNGTEKDDEENNNNSNCENGTKNNKRCQRSSSLYKPKGRDIRDGDLRRKNQSEKIDGSGNLSYSNNNNNSGSLKDRKRSCSSDDESSNNLEKEKKQSTEQNSEHLSSAMTLTSNFSYIIDQTCYLSVYLAQSVYDLDALEDWDSIEGPQFSLAQEDFTTLDQRLCAAFDHLFLPDNWTITGNSDENVKNQLDNRETLLHFAARLGLEKTILLLMTKARSRYAINIKNRHGELPIDIARKNKVKIIEALNIEDSKIGNNSNHNNNNNTENLDSKGDHTENSSNNNVTNKQNQNCSNFNNPFTNIEKSLENAGKASNNNNSNSNNNNNSSSSNKEPWLQTNVVNDRSVIKQNLDMETWALSSTADDDGKFQPISEDLRLLSTFGSQKIVNNFPLPASSKIEKGPLKSSSSFTKNTSNQEKSTVQRKSSLKKQDKESYGMDNNNNRNLRFSLKNSNHNQSGLTNNEKNKVCRRNSERKGSVKHKNEDFKDRLRRSRSWDSSNEDEKEENPIRKPETTARSIPNTKKQLSASDGKDHQHKKSSIRNRNNNNLDDANIRKSSSERNERSNRYRANNSESHGNETTKENLAWSDFVADSRENHRIVESDRYSGSRKLIGRKLSILDRLMQKGSIKGQKMEQMENSINNINDTTNNENSDLLSSDQANNSKNTTIPSRASSGASSSGFLSYKQTGYNSSLQTQDSGNSNTYKNSGSKYRERQLHNSKIREKRDSSSDESGIGNAINSSLNLDFNLENYSIRNLSKPDQNLNATQKNLDNFLLEKSLTSDFELWQLQVKDKCGGAKTLSQLTENEIKRQETIYEFIKTERSHFKNMLLINDVWKNGLKNNKNLKHIKVDKLLPGVESLLIQSRIFLSELHERQVKQYPVISSIGDVLANHWQEHEKDITKSFSKFCSDHSEALLYYKELIATDKKFANFTNEIRQKNITQRKDLPDALNIAMQRVTKYAIMVNKIKERTVSNKASEILDLEAAIDCIEIIAEKVDQEVKFINKERRLAFICRKFDKATRPVKSVGRKTSFGKADLSFDKRRLLFESRAIIKPTGLPSKALSNKSKKKDQDKSFEGILLLMTDYLVMLKPVSSSSTGNLLDFGSSKDSKKDKENKDSSTGWSNVYGTTANNDGMTTEEPDKPINYQFLNFSTGQPAVIPLRGLIIRENPTKDTDRFLLSAAHAEIGLYELSFESASIATTFAEQTRLAGQHCPDDIFLENQEKYYEKLSKNKNSKMSIKIKQDEEQSRQEYEEMVEKCDELMKTIRRCDQRILESISLKNQTNKQIARMKGLEVPSDSEDDDPDNENKTSIFPSSEALKYPDYELCEKLNLGPMVKEIESTLKTKIPGELQILTKIGKLHTIATQRDSIITNLRNDLNKQKTQSQHYNLYGRDITDLSKMERIHEIESKRFDRQRKKDRDEIKRLQVQLDIERDEIDDQKKKLKVQKDYLERQKTDFQYESEAKKNSDQQRTAARFKEMERYIDQLEARLEMHEGSNTFASTSPSNSFLLPTSTKSSTNISRKHTNNNKNSVKRTESSSPDRSAKNCHIRSKSSMGSRNSTNVSVNSQVSRGENEENSFVSRSRTSVSNDDKRGYRNSGGYFWGFVSDDLLKLKTFKFYQF